MTQDKDQTKAILDRLLGLHPKKIDLSLGRTQLLLERLGNPQQRLPRVIHVAGTNGKGSTIAFLRAMLEAMGRRVHVYTSPHLVRFNERIRLAGHLVDDDSLSAALAECEVANQGAPLTFFEVTTAAAFLLFSRVAADDLLLEVGLGGRFDATNVIDAPAACIITPISMDHPEFLGSTVEKIAFEKAGILKSGTPAVIGPQTLAVLRVLEDQGRKIGAPLWVARQDFHMREEHGRLIFEDEDGLIDLPKPHLPGRHQYENAAAAIATLRMLHKDLPVAIYEHGLALVRWPARLQRLLRGPLHELAPFDAELWLDGGHNEDGGRVIAQAMADFEDHRARPLILICGTLANKDTAGFLRAFKGLAQEVIGVPVPSDYAGRPTAEIVRLAHLEGLPAVASSSVPAALRYLGARLWNIAPRILIVGSLYLAGEVLRENNNRLD